MTRGAWRLGLGLALLAAAPGISAAQIAVRSMPVTTFKGVHAGETVDGLVWRGGLALASEAKGFGGLSGIAFTGADNRLAMVSDRGFFVSGRLDYDRSGTPERLSAVTVSAIENSRGDALPRDFARDAEAIETIHRDGRPAAVRVGFENLTRVADFDLTDGVPGGPAREVAIPDWLSAIRTNQSLEAVCIAPPASPVAGSTVLITESVTTDDGAHAAYMLGHRDKGRLSLTDTPGLKPTDCAFLPDGDLLVLERGVNLFQFVMRVRRIPAADVRPGREMSGEVILTGTGGDIDNMEGIAVHPGPDGQTRIAIVSDDNFNDWERTLLLEFSLR